MSDAPIKTNVPEMSVSELAVSLKRTLEETYGRVRVRGELSAVKIPSSGHMYSDLKDENSCINVICWKGTLPKLSVRPEEGLEVICTGRITTYPARSNYQLIIDSMELAGQGALLKMLEERRKKLAAEGLFNAERKRKLPYLPEVIGVITSPTGAVIRDILHRLADRFPRHVLVWPVAVQGEDAAAKVTAAISGFNNIQPGSTVPRPDLLIVARGGGSLEDLMPFNDEALVRAVAASKIPVISAIGHETDTTLIDYAADLRAPTPTAAAEKAVPVRLEILGWVQEQGRRMFAAAIRRGEEKKARLETLAAKLGDPERLLELRRQKLDLTGRALSAAFEKRISAARTASAQAGARLRDPIWLLHKKQEALIFQLHRLGKSAERLTENRDAKLAALSGRLRPPQALIQQGRERLDARLRALIRAGTHIVPPREKELEKSAKLLNALSYQKVLERGFAVVTNEKGHVVTDAAALKGGEAIEIRLHKGRKHAIVSEEKAAK